MTDPDVIAALQEALERDGGSLALRVHLAGLLLDAGRPAEALTQCDRVLAVAPRDPLALALRVRAAAVTPALRVLPDGAP